MKDRVRRGGLAATREFLRDLDADDVKAMAERLDVEPQNLRQWFEEILGGEGEPKKTGKDDASSVLLSVVLLDLIKKLPSKKERFGEVAV